MRNTSPSRAPLPMSRRSLWFATIPLLVSTLLAACGTATTSQQTSLFAASTVAPTSTATITPTAVMPTPTAQPFPPPTVAPIAKSSLPTLAPAAGWHTALTLSDTTGAHGGDIQQQGFIASKPYIILYSCKGSGGAVKVLYQHTVDGAYCTDPPIVNRTKTLRSTQPDHSAFVAVAPMGAIIWELLVEMED